MLETDCLIPVQPVEIELPETYKLYGIDHAVDVMRQNGMKKWQICKALRIGDDAWRDAIFEIRKKEMIEEMQGKRLTEEEENRAKMLRMAGATLHEIAAEIGCTRQTVAKALRGYKSDAAQDAPECAQSAPKAAPAQTTSKVWGAVTEAVRDSVSTQADEPAAEPVTVCTVPKAVLDAVCEHIRLEGGCIADKLAKIKRMQQEIERERTKIAELRAWLKEVNGYDGDPVDDPPATD